MRRAPTLLAMALLFTAHAVAATEDAPWDGTAGSLSLLPHLAQSMNKQQDLAQKCVDRWKSSPEETLAVGYALDAYPFAHNPHTPLPGAMMGAKDVTSAYLHPAVARWEVGC